MLALARSKKSKNVKFLGMAAERLIFKPETFDLVTMGDALSYVSDPSDALAEAHRVLRPGGRLAVSNQRRSLSTRAQDLFFQGLAPLARPHYLSLPRYSSDRARFGEPNVLPQLLSGSGFEVNLATAMVTVASTPAPTTSPTLLASPAP